MCIMYTYYHIIYYPYINAICVPLYISVCVSILITTLILFKNGHNYDPLLLQHTFYNIPLIIYI